MNASIKSILLPISFLFFVSNIYSGKQESAEIFLQLGHSNGIRQVAYSPDGKLLASASYDYTVKIWDLKSGKPIRTFFNDDFSYCVAFSPDGNTIAVGGRNGKVRFYDVSSGNEIDSEYRIDLKSDKENDLGKPLPSVYSVAFSSDGRLVAYAGDNYLVRVWDFENKKEYDEYSHSKENNKPILSVVFSPMSEYMASAREDDSIIIWNTVNQKIEHTKTGEDLPSSTARRLKGFTCLAFSPDGLLLAAGGNDRSVHLWDTTDFTFLKTLPGCDPASVSKEVDEDCHTHVVQSVAFSPDGEFLASGSEDKSVRIWEKKRDWRCVHTLTGHSEGVRSVVFGKDGKRLATAGYDRNIEIWNPHSGKFIRSLTAPVSRVPVALSFSRDGNILASLVQGKSLNLWDVEQFKNIRTIRTIQEGYSLAYRPDGKKLATGIDGNQVIIWDTSTGADQAFISDADAGKGKSISYSQTGKNWLAFGTEDSKVVLWNVDEKNECYSFPSKSSAIYSVRVSHDDKYLATGLADGNIFVWNIEDVRCTEDDSSVTEHLPLVVPDPKLKIDKAHTGKVLSLSFYQNKEEEKTYLVSGGEDRLVKLWDLNENQLIKKMEEHEKTVNSVDFNPTGQLIASGSEDTTVKIWRWQTGKVFTLSSPKKAVTSVVFHPVEPDRLAVASEEGVVQIWSVKSVEPDENEFKNLEVSFYVFDENDWIAYHPEKLVYGSSFQGNVYGAIRFGNRLESIYPLKYYEDKLLSIGNLRIKLETEPRPTISPKKFDRWWDNIPIYKKWLALSVTLTFIAALLINFRLKRIRFDPMEIGKKFFRQLNVYSLKKHSRYFFVLSREDLNLTDLVILWKSKKATSVDSLWAMIQKLKWTPQEGSKVYLIYKGRVPPTEILHAIQRDLNCDAIPLLSSRLEKAISTGEDCKRVLYDLRAPYEARTDPYDTRVPIDDPVWFFGRSDLLKEISIDLAQGQHIIIFGLRKVGKTSLMNIFSQRYVATPTVYLDCQAFGEDCDAQIYFSKIIEVLQTKLRLTGENDEHSHLKGYSQEVFQEKILDLWNTWSNQGNKSPFIMIFDEVDVLYPHIKGNNYDKKMTEYIRLFRSLRGLSQRVHCIVLAVISYRPYINRNSLCFETPLDNPMFQAFKEVHLGYLGFRDSEKMVIEIGHWKSIKWSTEAVKRVFFYCGGHPLITRMFASLITEKGKRKSIDMLQVDEVATYIKTTWRKNDLGNYYLESIWKFLTTNEKDALRLLCQKEKIQALDSVDSMSSIKNGFTSLENFGLVVEKNDHLVISSDFFRNWLKGKIS